MASLQFRLTMSHKDDLAAICAMGSRTLGAVAKKIELADFTIRRSQIERIMQDLLGPENGAALSRVIFGVASTFRRGFLTADEALDKVAQSLGDARQKDVRFRNWDECRPALKAVLETRSVSLAAKALDISYDFERVYLAGRLLTSIRPVFDPPRDNIVGSTIVQTLRLEYLAPNGDHSSISVALDLDDIKRLEEECAHAIKKAAEAKNRIEKDCAIEAITPGEEDHE